MERFTPIEMALASDIVGLDMMINHSGVTFNAGETISQGHWNAVVLFRTAGTHP